MPRIEVPSRYRIPTGGRAIIEVRGDTVRGCIEAAEVEYPGFGELVLDRNGGVRTFVTLFVNGDQLESGALDVSVGVDDTITVLAAAAGG